MKKLSLVILMLGLISAALFVSCKKSEQPAAPAPAAEEQAAPAEQPAQK